MKTCPFWRPKQKIAMLNQQKSKCKPLPSREKGESVVEGLPKRLPETCPKK
jgi:hypothetical protein